MLKADLIQGIGGTTRLAYDLFNPWILNEWHMVGWY
jgi:hypothetical protein